jgi:hypothetical protein
MKSRLCLALCLVALAGHALAQVSPAQMGITPTTVPEVVQVLDNTNTWVPIGSIDANHNFTPAGPAQPFVMFPGVPDGFVGFDGAMAVDSYTLTSASRACSSADLGKTVVVAGGGAADGSAPLHSSVTACNGAGYSLGSQNLYNDGVNGGLSADMWSIGTDQSGALNAFAAAHPNAHIALPCGGIDLDATTIALNMVWLDGCGVPGATNNMATNLSAGTMLIVTSATVQPAFALTRNVRTSNFNMVWPGQYGVTANPVVYGPAFSDNGSNIMSAWYADHISLLNAYDVFAQNPANLAMQTMHWDNVKSYSVRHVIAQTAVSEEFSLAQVAQNCNVSSGICSQGYAGAGNLKKWTDANGVFFYASGTGVGGGACPGPTHTSVKMTHVEIYDENIAFQAVGALWQESQIIGLDMSVNQLINADAGSVITGLGLSGGSYINLTGNVPAIDYESTCTGQFSRITITGNNINAASGLAKVNSSNLKNLTITGNKIGAFVVAPTALSYLWYQNDPTTQATFTGNTLYSANTGTLEDGVYIANATTVALSSNAANGFTAFADFSGYVSGEVIVSGNATSATQGPQSVVNASASPNIVIGANFFDDPFGHPTFAGCNTNNLHGGNAAGSFEIGGTCVGAQLTLTFATAAPNGWQCPTFRDLTTPADTWAYTSSTATSVTLTGTAASADVIQFYCVPY